MGTERLWNTPWTLSPCLSEDQLGEAFPGPTALPRGAANLVSRPAPAHPGEGHVLRRGRGRSVWQSKLPPGHGRCELGGSWHLTSRRVQQLLRRELDLSEEGESKGNRSLCTDQPCMDVTAHSRNSAWFETPRVPSPGRYLVDLILCRLQGLDDGLQLDSASLDALLQLSLFLLQSVQLRFSPVQVIFL